MYQLNDHGAQLKYEAALLAAEQDRLAHAARRARHTTPRRRGLRVPRLLIGRTATST